jgi:YHS domain-containing protein
MMFRTCLSKARVLGLGFPFLMVAVAGCNSQPPSAKSAEPPVVLDVPSAGALAALERADSADGNSDKRVTKCVACKLKMDGQAEHSVTFGEYQLYFCTDFCKAAFTKDPEKALASLGGS